MRRLLLSALTVFALSTTLSAQFRRDYEQELDLGVNGGLNLSKVSFLHNDVVRANEIGNQGLRLGRRLGVTFRYMSQRHFGIQLEVNHIQAGWSEKFQATRGDVMMVNGQDLQNVTLARRTEFIEIPVLSHIYFGKRNVRLIFNLGPELSCLVAYKSLESNIGLEDERLTAIPKDDPRWGNLYNRFDYGLTGGAGMNILIGRNLHLLLEARYTYAFGDLYSNSKSDVFQRSNNQYLQVMASVLFPVLRFKSN